MVDPLGIISPKKTDSPSSQPPPVPRPEARLRSTLTAPLREPAWPEPVQILRVLPQLLSAHKCICTALSRKPCVPCPTSMSSTTFGSHYLLGHPWVKIPEPWGRDGKNTVHPGPSTLSSPRSTTKRNPSDEAERDTHLWV